MRVLFTKWVKCKIKECKNGKLLIDVWVYLYYTDGFYLIESTFFVCVDSSQNF